MKYIIIFLTLLLSAPNVVANPYSDHKITCEEMEEFPELVFDSNSLIIFELLLIFYLVLEPSHMLNQEVIIFLLRGLVITRRIRVI